MQVINGSTDITTYFVLRDSANHAPKTDVTITDIDLYYITYQAAISSKVDATALAAADSAHSDNKAFHVGHGVYRIDWPDIWSGGVGRTVQLIVVCTGVDTTYLEVELVDPAQTGDAFARLGAPTGTSVSADIADIEGKVDDLEGRLTAARAGYLDNINNPALQTMVAQSGDAYARLGAPAGAHVSADIAAIKTQTAAIELDTQDLQTQIGVDGAGLTAIGDTRMANLDAAISTRLPTSGYTAPLSAAGTRTAIGLATANLDTQLAGLPTDADVQAATTAAFTAYDLPNKAELHSRTLPADEYAAATNLAAVKTVTDKLDTTLEQDGPEYRYTDNALEMAPAGGGGGGADPWDSVIPGTYDPGTAGYILGHALNTLLNVGIYSYSDTVTTPNDTPLDGALVILALDDKFNNIVTFTNTNAAGAFTVHSDTPGTHYLRIQLAGYSIPDQTVILT